MYYTGEAGAVGIIVDTGGNIVKSFSSGLGTKSNNEAKLLSLYHGFETN